MSNHPRLTAADIDRLRGYSTCDQLVGEDMAKALAEITDRRSVDLTPDELIAISAICESILEPLANGTAPEISVQPDRHHALVALAAIGRIALAAKVRQ